MTNEERKIQNALGTLSEEDQFLLKFSQEIKKVRMPSLASPNILKWYQKVDKELSKVIDIWVEIFEEPNDSGCILEMGIDLRNSFNQIRLVYCEIEGEERPDIVVEIYKQVGIYPPFLIYAAWFIWNNYRTVGGSWVDDLEFEAISIEGRT